MPTLTCLCFWGAIGVVANVVAGTGAVAAATGKCIAVWGGDWINISDWCWRRIIGFWVRRVDDWKFPGVAQDKPWGKGAKEPTQEKFIGSKFQTVVNIHNTYKKQRTLKNYEMFQRMTFETFIIRNKVYYLNI